MIFLLAFNCLKFYQFEVENPYYNICTYMYVLFSHSKIESSMYPYRKNVVIKTTSHGVP